MASGPDRLVIVGASLAGLRAAQAARAAGFAGELVIVGAEPHRPYTRPPLSKELLRGEQEPERCLLPGADQLQAQWRLGVRATALDRVRRVVVLSDGESIGYDRLILATGARPRPWRGPGAQLHGVHMLRGLDDALALRAALAGGVPLVIVGAGFIGCEVAASARARGTQVTLIDVLAAPMPALGPMLGRRCAQLHADHGVRLVLGSGVRALRGGADGAVAEVELEDGRRIEAGCVLVALGALPNVEWLAGSGLALEGGLLTDAGLTALARDAAALGDGDLLDGDVLAAGDIVCWPHPLAGGARVRVEHWTNAVEQGQLAGRGALLAPGERRAHQTVPYFWSDQYDVKIQAAGFPALAERVELLESSADGTRLVAMGVCGERVVGVVAFNAAARLARYRRELARLPAAEALRALARGDERSLGVPAGVAG
jgi:3-phenylpropionate/trans-cinnamate dioxygenase ferredoxin reductase subunit